MHVRLQLMYSHAWTCTLFGSGRSARPWIPVYYGLGCDFVDDHYTTHWWMAAPIPESSWMAATIPYHYWWSLQLGGCIHAIDHSCMSFGWLRPCLDYMYLIVRDFRSFLVMFQFGVCCKAFHPSHSLGLHALGGICYTVICHCLPVSHPTVSGVHNNQAHVFWTG